MLVEASLQLLDVIKVPFRSDVRIDSEIYKDASSFKHFCSRIDPRMKMSITQLNNLGVNMYFASERKMLQSNNTKTQT